MILFIHFNIFLIIYYKNVNIYSCTRAHICIVVFKVLHFILFLLVFKLQLFFLSSFFFPSGEKIFIVCHSVVAFFIFVYFTMNTIDGSYGLQYFEICL